MQKCLKLINIDYIIVFISRMEIFRIKEMEKLNLLRKSPEGEGLITVVSKDDPLMEYLTMDIVRLKESGRIDLGEEACELGMVILDGTCTVEGPGISTVTIKARTEPLAGWPHAVYVPAGQHIEIKADGLLNAVVFGTPAEPGEDVRIINPDDLEILDIGEGNWKLEGTFILYDKVPSKRLILGETHIPAGNWCSCPPHSHEKDVSGKETKLEEIYYFRFRPSQGFGFQGIYTLDGKVDEAYMIHDGDTVLVPRGNHPNVAGPGYEMYMLWGMAGPRKEWIPFEDPKHNWIGSVTG